MKVLKVTGTILGLAILATGATGQAATDAKVYAGHNCFSWDGPETATNSSAVYNPSTDAFTGMSVDCPIVHDLFFNSTPPATGGITSAFVRWQQNNTQTAITPTTCSLRATRSNSSGGFTTFVIGTAFPQSAFGWVTTNLTLSGASGNFDLYNYYLGCQLPPLIANPSPFSGNRETFLLAYGITEQGI